MKILKKIMLFLECLIILILISSYQIINTKAETNLSKEKVTIVDVVLYDFEDKCTSALKQNLEDIQKQNNENLKFNFYDSKATQLIQDEILSKISVNTNDALLINLVDTNVAQGIANKFKQLGVPLIFMHKGSILIESSKSHENDSIIEVNPNENNPLINLWNNNRTAIDINNNGVLQYIILQDSKNSTNTQEEMDSAILTLEDAGIQTFELAKGIATWNRKLAKDNINILFLIYGSNIETIITNDDEAAMGATDALQEHGYNLGDPKKTIFVVTVDTISDAKQIIKNDFIMDTFKKSFKRFYS